MTTNNLYHIDCLDKGFVELIDYMGSDDDICDAARCSIAGEGVNKAHDNNGLIRYLMRHRHTSPFEMAELKFRVKVPIFVWRQWIRHRTANVNEMSGRYSELPAEWYNPDPEAVKQQSLANKQGGDGMLPNSTLFCAEHYREASRAFGYYERHLEEGMARETARIGLPLSTYTVAIWKIDLHNLLHFISLRMHHSAQWEIQEYARALAEVVQAYYPLTWGAFEDYRLNSMPLTWYDQQALALIMAGQSPPADLFPSKREQKEWTMKLEKMRTLQLVMSIDSGGKD